MIAGLRSAALYGWTYPRHDELSAQILNLRFHLAANVELMTVQGNSLQVGQQILLARRIRALNGRERQGTHCQNTQRNNCHKWAFAEQLILDTLLRPWQIFLFCKSHHCDVNVKSGRSRLLCNSCCFNTWLCGGSKMHILMSFDTPLAISVVWH